MSLLNTSKIKTFSAFIGALLIISICLYQILTPVQLAEASSEQNIFVATNGNNSNNGTEANPLKTIQAALNIVKPGAKIIVKAGTYKEHLVTKTDGTNAAPITVQAEGKVILRGVDNTRILDLFHNFYIIEGFEFDGGYNETKSVSKTIDKLLWVEAASFNKIRYNYFHHAQGECIRVLFFSEGNTFQNNTIENCGMRDFVDFRSESSKNGEGIYIGIAPEQLESSKCKSDECKTLISKYKLKKNSRETYTKNNVISHNFIDTHANECVDVKEGSNGNIITDNVCISQYDRDSAAFDTRGDRNTFIHNTVGFSNVYDNHVKDGDLTSSKREKGHKILGAAFRAGGDKLGDGQLNNFVKNDVLDYLGSAKVVLKISLGDKQGVVCQNTVKNMIGNFASNGNTVNATTCSPEFTTADTAGVRGCVGHTCRQGSVPPIPTPTPTPIPPPVTPPTPTPTPVPPPVEGKPTAPINLKVNSPSDSKIELSWDPVNGATKYNVYWTYSRWNYVYEKLTSTSKTNITESNARSKSTYMLYVTSVNSNGIESNPSETVSVLVK